MSGGGAPAFGTFGAPGFVSPFDMQAIAQGQASGMEAMGNRFAQLGLSAQGATPTSPGGAAGGIGVGNIGNQGAVTPDPNAAPTAERMDLGNMPSLSGGIPGEFQAVQGMVQDENLQNASMSSSGSGGKGGGAGSAIGAIAPLALGGK